MLAINQNLHCISSQLKVGLLLACILGLSACGSSGGGGGGGIGGSLGDLVDAPAGGTAASGGGAGAEGGEPVNPAPPAIDPQSNGNPTAPLVPNTILRTLTDFAAAGVIVRATGLSGQSAMPTQTSAGIGVVDGSIDIEVPSQINRLPDGRSETLEIDFGPQRGFRELKISFSNLIPTEGGGERGKWEARDVRGVKIAEGIFGRESVLPNTVVGSFTIRVDQLAHSLVFSGVSYVNGDSVSTRDSSDYFVSGIEGFVYTLP